MNLTTGVGRAPFAVDRRRCGGGAETLVPGKDPRSATNVLLLLYFLDVRSSSDPQNDPRAARGRGG
jgi:hypothetical protein